MANDESTSTRKVRHISIVRDSKSKVVLVVHRARWHSNVTGLCDLCLFFFAVDDYLCQLTWFPLFQTEQQFR